jgi:hypothetical protein
MQQAAPKAPPPPPIAEAGQAQSASRTSLGMKVGGTYRDTAEGQDNDGLAAQKQVAQNLDDSKRRIVTELDAQLASARSADLQNDAQTELTIAQQVLSHNPHDRQRMEALVYACKAAQRLENPGATTKYCTALANEFPGNEVGQRWAENQRRLAPAPAARAKKGAYNFDDELKEQRSEPAQAAPPPAQPASQQYSH